MGSEWVVQDRSSMGKGPKKGDCFVVFSCAIFYFSFLTFRFSACFALDACMHVVLGKSRNRLMRCRVEVEVEWYWLIDARGLS